MEKIKSIFQKYPRVPSIIALTLMGLSLLWYGDQFLRFGIAFDSVDLMGSYFIASTIALIMLLKSGDDILSNNRFMIVVGTLSTMAFILFLGQFLGKFGGVYHPKEPIAFHVVRSIFLIATGIMLYIFKPNQHFIIHKYLLIITGCAGAYWAFVYGFPLIVREWYGTRGAPSEMFPDGLLLLSKRNPERDVQRDAFIIFIITWLITVISGRLRYKKMQDLPQSQDNT